MEGPHRSTGPARATTFPLWLRVVVAGSVWLLSSAGCAHTGPELYGPPYVPGRMYNSWQVLVALQEFAGRPADVRQPRPDWARLARDIRERVRWVSIPAGAFSMGCAGRAPADTCLGDELPAHKVRLTRAFDMMATEVTRSQFLTFWLRSVVLVDAATAPRDDILQWLALTDTMQDAVVEHRFQDVAAALAGDDRVMVGLTWDDAREVCQWLGGRLPTEAQWEYAARGGSDGAAYPWGNDAPTCERAQFGACGPGQPDADRVARRAPNALGLYDMAGNAGEWVSDWYSDDAYTRTAGVDPAGPGPGYRWKPKDTMGPFAFLGLLNWESEGLRVIRGGDYAASPVRLRVASRDAGEKTDRGHVWESRNVFSRAGCRCVRNAR